MAHPAVALCAVVGEPDAYAGELPVAYVVLRPRVLIDPARLLAEVAPTVYERPAAPKRVTVLPSLPMTAIGKVYKPALRLLAIETKLAEMLAPLGAPVRVTGEDRGGKLVAVLEFDCPRDAALEARVRDALAAISAPIDIRFAG